MNFTQFDALAKAYAARLGRREVVSSLAVAVASGIVGSPDHARTQSRGCNYDSVGVCSWFAEQDYNSKVAECNVNLTIETIGGDPSPRGIGKWLSCTSFAKVKWERDQLRCEVTPCSSMSLVCAKDSGRPDGMSGTCCGQEGHASAGTCIKCPACSETDDTGNCGPCRNCRRCVNGACSNTHGGHTWFPDGRGGCCVAGYATCVQPSGSIYCCDPVRVCGPNGGCRYPELRP